jgi:hypothetical protein
MSFRCPDLYRVRSGPYGSDSGDNFGAFFVPTRQHTAPLKILASDGLGGEHEPWEHVSVSLPDRCPTWKEMSLVKSLFWADTDCVIQFHPPRSEYVNNHDFCLHLWRPVGREIPLPPSILVGFKSLGVLR